MPHPFGHSNGEECLETLHPPIESLRVRIPECQAPGTVTGVSTLAIDWGDVPNWVSAITTLGALVAAGWIVKIELRRDGRLDEARQRGHQADLIAVWHEVSMRPTSPGHTSTKRPGIRITNGSALPVSRMLIEVSYQGWRVASETLQTVPPGEIVIDYPKPSIPDELRPTDGSGMRYEDFELSIEFADTANIRWRRDSDGYLQRADKD